MDFWMEGESCSWWTDFEYEGDAEKTVDCRVQNEARIETRPMTLRSYRPLLFAGQVWAGIGRVWRLFEIKIRGWVWESPALLSQSG